MNEVDDGRKFDFFIIDNELITVHAAKIGINALGVYMVLLEIAGRSSTCFPSTTTIAELLGITRPTVSRAIKTLKEHGLIDIEERTRPDKGQTSNKYTIKPVEKSRPAPPVNDVYTPPQEYLHPPVNDVSTNNTRLNKTQGTRGGGDTRERQTAAAETTRLSADQREYVAMLEARGFDTPGQASLAVAKQPFSLELFDRLDLLIVRLKGQGKNPVAIIWPYLKAGKLPNDLPAAAVKVTAESRDEAIRRHLEDSKTAVSHATFR